MDELVGRPGAASSADDRGGNLAASPESPTISGRTNEVASTVTRTIQPLPKVVLQVVLGQVEYRLVPGAVLNTGAICQRGVGPGCRVPVQDRPTHAGKQPRSK